MPRKKKKNIRPKDDPDLSPTRSNGLIYCELCIYETPMLLSSFHSFDSILGWKEEDLRKKAVDSLLWKVRESPYTYSELTEDHLLGFTDEELYNWGKIKFYNMFNNEIRTIA